MPLRPLYEPDTLARLLPERHPGETVVFTNGCFDLIHRGHVETLDRAKALGDVLVVALNSDDSVRRLKGPERPLTPLADRAAVVAALAPVDYVTSFGEATPIELIRRLPVTVLVKGGDWPEDLVVGKSRPWRVRGTRWWGSAPAASRPTCWRRSCGRGRKAPRRWA